MNNSSIADLRTVSKKYTMGESEVFALKGLQLRIERKEYIAIMGPSGSGKSTLLNILGGIDIPSGGEVYLDGKRIDNLSEKALLEARRKTVTYIFQEARLLSSLSALENVLLPLAFRNSGSAGSKAKERARLMLEKVGLGKRAYHLPHQLSGGEAQRVSIARALMCDPLLILADEPTGNLDTKTGEEIMSLFGQLNSEGLTIVMVTHDPQKASHAKRIIRLRDGEVVEDSYNHKYGVCAVD
ncbi:MAG: ABC transporter ATP-binding protein [Alphaproteobacteria bacterium]|uniref:ABC transporter ATP-binding protein n=1 Tax=Candidatus Nitrobium versatile TaxID=2884831 RepID=A0A953J8F1_9BACT|nr:ABC transporter ATP-binding protein [Candidatus Nitrobium versatile]